MNQAMLLLIHWVSLQLGHELFECADHSELDRCGRRKDGATVGHGRLNDRPPMAPTMTCGVCNGIASKLGDPSAAPRHCELKQILVRHRSGPHH